MSLVESLIVVSEKAANIARLCRQEQKLFELLIQEKSDVEANPRYLQDFKTLADVLIQETVKHDIGKKFPELENEICGEESNVFENKLGDKVLVKIQKTADETMTMLEKVLDGNASVAKMLAGEVHKDLSLESIEVRFPEGEADLLDFDYSDYSVWIDPIDSTSEYISGKEEKDESSGIYRKGLRCVTILMGVYSKKNGCPVIGVINQPFYQSTEDNRWSGRCFWGIAHPSMKINSLLPKVEEKLPTSKIICLSSSETDRIRDKLSKNNFTIVESAGAGYKLLVVILGLADAYVLSKGTTFMWDTCGCQAILRSLGGDIVQFYGDRSPLLYRKWEEGVEDKLKVCCHSNGIIAARSQEILLNLIQIITISE